MDYSLRYDFLLFLFEDLLLCGCLLFCHNFLLSDRFLLIDARSATIESCSCRPQAYFLPGAFFLVTVARRGPLRVRALVWVR